MCEATHRKNRCVKNERSSKKSMCERHKNAHRFFRWRASLIEKIDVWKRPQTSRRTTTKTTDKQPQPLTFSTTDPYLRYTTPYLRKQHKATPYGNQSQKDIPLTVTPPTPRVTTKCRQTNEQKLNKINPHRFFRQPHLTHRKNRCVNESKNKKNHTKIKKFCASIFSMNHDTHRKNRCVKKYRHTSKKSTNHLHTSKKSMCKQKYINFLRNFAIWIYIYR